jgi:hypothetical protein
MLIGLESGFRKFRLNVCEVVENAADGLSAERTRPAGQRKNQSYPLHEEPYQYSLGGSQHKICPLPAPARGWESNSITEQSQGW